MNKNIAKPLIIQFTPPENQPVMKRSSKSLFVPVNAQWADFRDKVLPLVTGPDYDSVLVHVTGEVDRDQKGVMSSMAVKMNALGGAGNKVGKPVLTYESVNEPFYLANPAFEDKKGAPKYAPADEAILKKYDSYESDAAWQEHQSKIWGRMKDMMPLSRKADQFNRNHAAQLKDPKRGLQEKDLEKFWSFKAGQSISPTIMGDDMVGMPSVEGRDYEGFTISVNQPDGTVMKKNLKVRSLQTAGASGIMIPMANADGFVSKHQVATDLTPYGTALHFRAADGRTVAKGELFDKKTREYSFKFEDGTDTHLKVTAVAPDDTITMQDAHGIFNVKPKSEIVDTLKSRGYNVPEIISSVKPEANGKYVWQAPGTMTGSDEVLKKVSPSNPGFIVARAPKNGETQYNVLVVEGALKGQIVAKYVDVKDKNGICFGDRIAGNKGIIVTQVPGVAEAYVKNAVTIYDKYDVKGTYIAMDADGRENRNVANGIHTAYNYIKDFCPTTVLSWDPAQKGMDDALLAVAQGKITVDEMGIVSGKPEALFPLDKAHAMLPYRLDGTVSSKPAWQTEYVESKKDRMEAVAAAQAATAARQVEPAPEEYRVEKSADAVQVKKTDSWVQTPQDISNIQNMTVAKSADMADAMAGKLPPAKPDSRMVHTPDVDEMIEPDPEPAKEESVKQESVVKDEVGEAVERWDAQNPSMPPLAVPEGYKADFVYKQAVRESTRPGIPNFTPEMDYQADGKWGVVTIRKDHSLADAEKAEYRESLSKGGLDPVKDMRLVEQSFSLDNKWSVELSAEDMNIGNDDGLSR